MDLIGAQGEKAAKAALAARDGCITEKNRSYSPGVGDCGRSFKWMG